VDITAGCDFLDPCDQNVNINMGPVLNGYGGFLIGVNALL
jgi:hypothetical protein